MPSAQAATAAAGPGAGSLLAVGAPMGSGSIPAAWDQAPTAAIGTWGQPASSRCTSACEPYQTPNIIALRLAMGLPGTIG